MVVEDLDQGTDMDDDENYDNYYEEHFLTPKSPHHQLRVLFWERCICTFITMNDLTEFLSKNTIINN